MGRQFLSIVKTFGDKNQFTICSKLHYNISVYLFFLQIEDLVEEIEMVVKVQCNKLLAISEGAAKMVNMSVGQAGVTGATVAVAEVTAATAVAAGVTEANAAAAGVTEVCKLDSFYCVLRDLKYY